MQEKNKETPNWNPPSPPWNPEPEPLSLRGKEEAEPEPVNEGLEAKVEEMVESGDLKLEVIDAPGFKTYTVVCPTGITINGKVFAAGPHSVDEDTHETLETLDKPYQ